MKADLSEMCSDSTLVRPASLGLLGFMVSRPHWRVEFDIELNFGKPELEAVLKWQVDVRPLF